MKFVSLMTVLSVAAIGSAAVSSVVEAYESAAPTTKEEVSTVKELSVISAADLQNLIKENTNLVIFDSRSPSQYAEGHIPGAVALRASDATPERLAALAGEDKATPMVFYCGNLECPASGKTAYKAKEAGYTNLHKYAEGMDDWKAKGLPVVAD